MAFNQFNKIKIVNVFESDETLEMGRIQLSANGELKHIRAELHIHGNLSGGEKVRCKIGLTSDDTAPYATSDWVVLTTFDTSDGTDDFIGWLRFDFDRENVNSNENYYVWIESDSYTRNADTFYIAMVLDHPYATYSSVDSPALTTFGMQVFTFVES